MPYRLVSPDRKLFLVDTEEDLQARRAMIYLQPPDVLRGRRRRDPFSPVANGPATWSSDARALHGCTTSSPP